MNRLKAFKIELSHIFDDNLNTLYRWHNYIDYIIISLIIISNIIELDYIV